MLPREQTDEHQEANTEDESLAQSYDDKAKICTPKPEATNVMKIGDAVLATTNVLSFWDGMCFI